MRFFSSIIWLIWEALPEYFGHIVAKPRKRNGMHWSLLNTLRKRHNELASQQLLWSQDWRKFWEPRSSLDSKQLNIELSRLRKRRLQLDTDEDNLIASKDWFKFRITKKFQKRQRRVDKHCQEFRYWEKQNQYRVHDEMCSADSDEDANNVLKAYLEHVRIEKAKLKGLEVNLDKWKSRLEDFNNEFGVLEDVSN